MLLDVGRGRRANLLLLVVVVGLALALRVWGLGQPPGAVFDEHFYAFDAYAYLGGTPELGLPDDPVKIPNEATWEHPPLGKELIAAGEGPLGFNTVGWRLPSAIAGTAGVALAFLLGLALFGRTRVAAMAAALTALDGVHIVQSRLAMLDIFLATFVSASLLFALLYRRFGGTRWLVWAGVALGAALSSKWSAALFVPVVAAVVLATTRDVRTPRRRIGDLLMLVAASVTVYLLAYLPFWLAHGPAVSDFALLHVRMFDRLHHGVLGEGSPPFATSPIRWPVMLDAISYFEADGRQIVSLGNPALWWGFVAAAPLLAVRVVRRDLPALVVAGMYIVGWAPWLLLGRPTYSYYLVAVVPFMALGLASVCASVGSTRIRSGLSSMLVAATVAGAAAFVHLWVGGPFPAWHSRLRWLPGWPLA